MPTRHLSDEQRQRYANFAVAPSPDQLAQYFHLDRSDRESSMGCGATITPRLCAHAGIGQISWRLSWRRCPKSPALSGFPGQPAPLKEGSSVKGYFDLGGQRIRHLALIRQRYGFTEFADDGPARFRLTRWLYALCWSGDDHPGPLVERATSWLIVNKVLLPGVSVLERFVGRIRDRAQKRLWKRLSRLPMKNNATALRSCLMKTARPGLTALDSLRTCEPERGKGCVIGVF